MIFYIYTVLSFIATMAFWSITGQQWQVLVGLGVSFSALWMVKMTIETTVNHLFDSFEQYSQALLHNQKAIYDRIDILVLNKCPELRKEMAETPEKNEDGSTDDG